MIILSQDRKTIVREKKLCSIQVVKNIGGPKDGKYNLTADSGFTSSAVLGQYADEKTAIDELEKIYAAMTEGAESYRVN